MEIAVGLRPADVTETCVRKQFRVVDGSRDRSPRSRLSGFRIHDSVWSWRSARSLGAPRQVFSLGTPRQVFSLGAPLVDLALRDKSSWSWRSARSLGASRQVFVVFALRS